MILHQKIFKVLFLNKQNAPLPSSLSHLTHTLQERRELAAAADAKIARIRSRWEQLFNGLMNSDDPFEFGQGTRMRLELPPIKTSGELERMASGKLRRQEKRKERAADDDSPTAKKAKTTIELADDNDDDDDEIVDDMMEGGGESEEKEDEKEE